MVYKLLLVFVFSMLFTLVNAQLTVQSKSKKNNDSAVINVPPHFKRQADSINKVFIANGYELLKAEFLGMETSFERSILLPLGYGKLYHIIFISDSTSKLQELRMFDQSEKMILYKKLKWAEIDGNIISEAFIPTHDEFYMLRYTQESKKKKFLAGGFLLFKALGSSENIKWKGGKKVKNKGKYTKDGR